jgi:hypothetical protein
MGEIKSLSIRHEAIMDYLMANPTHRLQDVAANFRVSGPWLSQIIHSDIFQNKLKEKTDVVFHATVLPIREKMTLVAHQALDKVMDNLPLETDLRTTQSIAEGMLDRLGFGAKPIAAGGNLTINQQNNVVNLPNTTRDEIANARKMLEQSRSLGLGVTVNGESLPIALPRASMPDVGETMRESGISFSEGENTARENGGQV